MESTPFRRNWLTQTLVLLKQIALCSFPPSCSLLGMMFNPTYGSFIGQESWSENVSGEILILDLISVEMLRMHIEFVN